MSNKIKYQSDPDFTEILSKFNENMRTLQSFSNNDLEKETLIKMLRSTMFMVARLTSRVDGIDHTLKQL